MLEQGEQQPHGLLHLLVGIEDESAGRVKDQADRRAHPQLALLRPGQLAAEEPVAKPVKFRFAHGAQYAQEQAIRILAGVVDAVLVDDERIGQGADLQQPVPVGAGPGQPGRFEADDGPGLAEPDLCHQQLEPVAVHRGRAGPALILIDDRHRCLRPAQILGALHQVVLPCGAGRVFADLEQSRLSNVDAGEAFKMVGANFEIAAWHEHDRSPW